MQAVPADRLVRLCIVWDAGIPLPVTRGFEQAQRDLFRSLVNPDPAARKMLYVQDFTLSAWDGFVVDDPALPYIAICKVAGAIYVLLDPAPRWADRAPPVTPAAPAPLVAPAAPAPPVTPAAPTRPVIPAAAARPDTPVRVRIVWDSGIPSPITRALGQAERDLFRALVSPDPRARKVLDVRDADFTLSAGDGFVVDSPALPRVVVGKVADAVNVILVPDPPDPRSPDLPDLLSLSPVKEFFPTVKKISRNDEPGPGSPVRKPGFGFGPIG